MSTLRSVLARRRSALLGLTMAALAVAFVLLLPATSDAEKCGLEFWYFSDAAHTDLIGMRGYFPSECGCGSYGWGSVSVRREIYDSFC